METFLFWLAAKKLLKRDRHSRWNWVLRRPRENGSFLSLIFPPQHFTSSKQSSQYILDLHTKDPIPFSTQFTDTLNMINFHENFFSFFFWSLHFGLLAREILSAFDRWKYFPIKFSNDNKFMKFMFCCLLLLSFSQLSFEFIFKFTLSMHLSQ